MKRFAYDEINKKASPTRRILLSILFFILIFVAFILGTQSLSEGNKKRQLESLEATISRHITYHYAKTGSYPSSLAEITQLYGLNYDTDSFFVDYTTRGQNVLPDVTVIEK